MAEQFFWIYCRSFQRVPGCIIFVFQAVQSPEVLLRNNVKVIASLVRKAKKKLNQGKKTEALELMRKAVNTDDNKGILVQVIKVIGNKKPLSALEVEPVETVAEEVAEELPEEVLEEELEEVPEEAPEEIPEETPEVSTEEPPFIIEHGEYVYEPLGTAKEVSQDPPFIEDGEYEYEPLITTADNNIERDTSMSSEDQVTELLEASDREYDDGEQQKAVNYLKMARKLDPDNPEVRSKIEILKTKIKSANLVNKARKKLLAGEIPRAVVLTRQAFKMRPDAAGLDELLSDLENESGISSPESPGRFTEKLMSISCEEYITVIRELVQDNSPEKAALVAVKAIKLFPDDDLLLEFVSNFRKLGLLD